MLLRNFKSVVPNVEDNIVPHFVVSELKDVVQEIKDADGKVVSSRTLKMPVVRELSIAEFEHAGESVDLFSVENQLAAGNNLFTQSPITQPFFRPTLDQKSQISDALENMDYTELTEQDFEPSVEPDNNN